jgi:hypothetical protein
MSELCTQQALQTIQKLPFCYLCGKGFTGKTRKNRDHVPPKSIFASKDRETPLILPTHPKCNEARSDDDEIVGQLVAAFHGKYAKSEKMKLDVRVVEGGNTDEGFLGLIGTNFHKVIYRWLRAFHSALYSEYLPNETKNSLHLPFPSGNVGEHNQVVMDEILPQHQLFVEKIKKNRAAQRLDRIICYNCQCIYECFWDTADGGQQICIFALKVYNWSALADTDNFAKRGCVGMYMPVKGKPANATTGTRLHLSVSNIEKLDPYGS